MDDDTRVARALGTRVRALREGRGWTQERLAAEAGLHRTYPNGIEAGARNPALRNIVRLAAAPRADEEAKRPESTRHRRGLTQEELEGRSRLTVRAISEIESGRHLPLPDTIARLSDALELAPAQRALFLHAVERERDWRRARPGLEGNSDLSPLGDHPSPASVARGGPLPALLTSFVGRDDERQQVKHFLLATRSRLVTLTGAPGTGKTRLALEVAAAIGDRFADGASFVPLAPLRDATLIPVAIARALGLGEPGEQLAPETLSDFLRGKALLLVLDNAEHLLLDNAEHLAAAAAVIHDLLAAAPDLTILATSRVPLRLYGEQVVPVPPLGTPPRRAVPALPPDELAARYPAVALFVDRARLVRPTFTLRAADAPTVARICTALDGLPLAIELAAARCATLSPAAILARLRAEGRRALLTQQQHNVLVPHRTLDEAIAWSQRLLSAPQQTLFRRLAVFAGGCTAEAAAAVCVDPGDATVDVRGQAAALSNVALVQIVAAPDADDEQRIGMLETIRAYAARELERSGEGKLLRQRHARYYLDLARQAEGRLLGGEQLVWLRRLEREHDNLRAALRRLLEDGDAEDALWLAALWLFWFIHGHAVEGGAWLEQALSRANVPGLSPGVAPRARARALFASGFLALHRADTATAEARYTEALRAYRALGDRRGEAWALLGLAQVAYRRADDRAWPLHHEALELFRDVGDVAGIGWALGNLGLLARPRGEGAQASRRYLEEAVEAWRGLGDWWGRSAALGYLANDAYVRGELAADRLYGESVSLLRDLGFRAAVAWRLNSQGDVVRLAGDAARAGALYQESHDLFAGLGIDEGRAWSLHNRGYVALGGDDARRAAALFAESLTLFGQRDDRGGQLSCLAGLAGVLDRRGQSARAARLIGAVSALRAVHGVRFEPVDEAAYRRIASGLRARLGAAAWAANTTQGRALSLERAVEEGRAAARDVTAATPTDR